MKSFKILLVAVLFALLLTSHVRAAQGGFDGKVAYVDFSRLFDEYGKTKEYDAVLEKKHSEYEAARNKKLEKIRDEQNKLSLLI